MAKKNKKEIVLDLSSDWNFAPSPESTSHIKLKKKWKNLHTKYFEN